MKVVKSEYKDPVSKVVVESDVFYNKATGKPIRGYGQAKRLPGDEISERVGIEIALLKAKQDLKAKIAG